MNYETVIGLEVHVELLTEHKIFCGCRNRFGQAPNTDRCEICTGLPGAIPVYNDECTIPAVAACIVLGCEISEESSFDRKNYFYPDLPKGYQITQFYRPFGVNGMVVLPDCGKTIRIKELHLEDDAAKLSYSGEGTLIDYNRCGVPLIEIVTEPDFSKAEEVTEFLEILRRDLRRAGVSDARLEQGSMRADVNISVRRPGEKPGVRTETKNLSSFRACSKAIEYEGRRQIGVLESGGRVLRETLRFDEKKEVTIPMRSKEDLNDYKYFPEPDIPPVNVSLELIRKVRSDLPELMSARKARFISDYGLRRDTADTICADEDISDLYDECALASGDHVLSADLIKTRVIMLKKEGKGDIAPAALAGIVKMLSSGTVTRACAMDLIDLTFREGIDPVSYAKSHDLTVICSRDIIESAVIRVMEDPVNAKALSDLLSGNDKVRGFFVGKTMRELKGRGDPGIVGETVDKVISQKRGF